MFGFHLILDIFDCNIESIRDEAVIREFLNVLLYKIKMKKMAEPTFIYLSDENDERYCWFYSFTSHRNKFNNDSFL